jgi:serine acetyltransferase
MTWINPQKEIEHLKFTRWNWLVSYPENFNLSNNSVDIGALVYFQCKYGITVESGVKIGSHCAFFSEDTIGGNSGPVIIKEGTSIGTHSTILPNTIIGKSCRIGAYSLIKSEVVLGDGIVLPAYSFAKKSILTKEDLDVFLMKENKRPFNFSGLL